MLDTFDQRRMISGWQREMAVEGKYLENNGKKTCHQDDEEEFVPIS
jgi:hypothetical protein